nr:GGDEF domain-containing protein [Deinococcus budaensis]
MQAPRFDPLDRVALPVLGLTLLGLHLALALGRLRMRVAINVGYGLATLYLLLALRQQFQVFAPQAHTLSPSTYWFTVLYAVAFLLYPPRLAGVIAGGVYLLTLALCLVHLLGPGAGELRLAASTAQFLLVGVVMIIVQATFGMQRVQLLAAREAAYRDALTGLANRRAAEERLSVLADGSQAFTLVLFDLDHFKAVNDTFGHAVGDQVLRGVARAAQESLPLGGHAARWGGEEFLLILPPLSTRQLRATLDTLRSRLSAGRHGPVTGVTASFGVASARPGEHPDAVLTRADAAMYAAKQRGRDDVHHADPSSTTPGVPGQLAED